jgi:anti-anti-sigma factor
MNIQVDSKPGALVIRVSGRMDAVTAPEFDQACGKWISEGTTKLVLDLRELHYISSAGLRSILSTGKTVKAQGGQLLLCNLKGMVREIFEISGFFSIFPVYPTEEDALANS